MYLQSRLREIFLKTDNLIGGRYLAELTQQVRPMMMMMMMTTTVMMVCEEGHNDDGVDGISNGAARVALLVTILSVDGLVYDLRLIVGVMVLFGLMIGDDRSGGH